MKLKMMLIALLSMAPIFGINGGIFQGVGGKGLNLSCDQIKVLRNAAQKDLTNLENELNKLKQQTGFLAQPNEAKIKRLQDAVDKLKQVIAEMDKKCK